MHGNEITSEWIGQQVDNAINELLNEQQKSLYNRSVPLLELGLGSQEFVALQSRFSKDFTIDLSPTFFFQYGSAEAVIRYLIEKKIELYKDWLYEIQWWPSKLIEAPPFKINGLWLLMIEDDDFSIRLRKSLIENQQECVTIKPGNQYNKIDDQSYEVDIDSPENFDRLLKDIPNLSRLSGIVYLWGYELPKFELSYPVIESALKKTCMGLVNISNALAQIQISDRFKMWVINKSIETDGNKESLLQVPLNALCKSIWEEYPAYKCCHLALDVEKSLEENCIVLCNELRGASIEPEIAWRKGERQVPRMVPGEIDQFIRPQFEEDASYLVAGGLRPLGFEVAQWYIHHGAKNIILLDELVITQEMNAEISRLKAQGVNIVPFVTSFDNFSQLQNFFDDILDKIPPLKGVIHAAGIIEQDWLIHLKWDRFENANRLKIAGSWHLHELTKSLPLDHFILFSTSLIHLAPGNRGAYLVANSFLDALSYYRSNLGLPSLTIDWGPWITRKMLIQHITDFELNSRLKLINPAEGMLVFDNIFYTREPQIMTVQVKWEALFRQAIVQNPLFDEIALNFIPVKEVHSIEPIAIIGMGCRFPGGADSPEKFWDLLKTGRDGVIEIPKDRWDVEAYYDSNRDAPGKMYIRQANFLQQPIDTFDAEFFGISRREAEEMDPQQRLLLEVCFEALEHAGIAPDKIAGTDAGVFIGVMFDDYLRNLDQGPSRGQISPYYASGNLFSVVSGRVSYFLGINGPCLTVDTACSSSLVSIDIACKRLHMRETSLAIAGGVNLTLRPESVIMECKANMLAEDGRCKTFDASADGFGRGEGCGVVILKRLSDALRDGDHILALIKGTAVNHGGATNGLTVPSGLAQMKLLRIALANAKISAEDVSYLEAHGTGTTLGDAIEVEAFGTVFKRGDKENPLVIGSVKTNIGHTESAAGVAGVIKVVLSLQNKEIPAHLNLKKINPIFDLTNIPAFIPSETIPWPRKNKPRIAGVSSFGFSGINAHIILEEAPENPQKSKSMGPFLLVLSAKKEEAVREEIVKLKDFLERHTDINMADVAYTLQTGRQAFPYRTAVVCKDRNDAIALLSTLKRIELCKGRIVLKKTDLPKDMREVAELWLKGARINWNAYYVNEKPRRIPLPTYPFQRQKYWSEAIAKGKTENINTKVSVESDDDLSTLLKTASEEKQKIILKDFIRKSLERILKESPEDNKNFYEQGIDSIMIGELRKMLVSAFQNQFEIALSTIMDNPTVDKLTDAIFNYVHYNKTSKQESNPGEWIIEQRTAKLPKLRLFCFHHAGGGASAFSAWRAKLPDDISLCLIQLPGREIRRNEPFSTDLESVIAGIIQSMQKYLDLPFVFFGHSMGSYIAFEVANRLNVLGAPLPKSLILSSFSPFSSKYSQTVFSKPIDKMTDEEFLEYIEKTFGGIPPKLLANKELLKVFIPILRADFSLFKSVKATGEKLNVPITTIYCTEDRANTEESIKEWEKATQNSYKNIRLPGGHFEILNLPDPFIEIILRN